jgi:hypothetical protein
VDVGESVQGWIFWTWKVCSTSDHCWSTLTGRVLISSTRGIRLKTRTSGVIKRASGVAGYLKIRRRDCIPTSAPDSDVMLF